MRKTSLLWSVREAFQSVVTMGCFWQPLLLTGSEVLDAGL